MLRVQLLALCFFLASSIHAILPLPYSAEPPPEEGEPGEVETIDAATIPGYSDLFSHSKLREMELPSFNSQANALGYEAGKSFSVPASLRSRVDFWKKIYTVYTSSQALMHDAENLNLVYGTVDLSFIKNNEKLSASGKKRAIARFLKTERRRLERVLKHLHASRDTPNQIALGAFPIFRKFEHEKDPSKFLRASKNVRAQVGQRDKIVQGFLFGGRYWKQLMDIFEQRGIPKELTRLPLVESAFDLSARSKVGASGVWQFMRSTGKRFLRIDRGIDERNDPILATWAAAELLRQNFETLESWPLAITAYNHGREGMARAVRKLETRDLAEIIERYESSTFGFASSNFYCEFLAILEVEREYRQHFGNLFVDSPIEYEQVASLLPVKFETIAKRCGIEPKELASLNPAFTPLTLSGRIPVPGNYAVRVPKGTKAACGFGNFESENQKTLQLEENV